MFDRTRQDTGRSGLAQRAAPAKPIHIEELESDPHNPFDPDEPSGNRWLLTTCVAGIAGSLVVGTALLGVLGSGNGGDSALASVTGTEIWQRTQAMLKGDYNGEIRVAVKTQPYDPNFNDQTIADRFNGEVISANVVVPQREFTGSISGAYPSINADALPYAPPDQPLVLSGSVRISALDSQNITTIAKTPPPEPIDQSVVLAKGETLTDRLITMGVTVEAAKSLVGAVEPVYPQKLLKPEQVFEVTIDKQQDFYGNEVIYPSAARLLSCPQRGDRRRVRRRRTIHRPLRWQRAGCAPHARRPGDRLSRPCQDRLEPLRHRQGPRRSRLHHQRDDARLRL